MSLKPKTLGRFESLQKLRQQVHHHSKSSLPQALSSGKSSNAAGDAQLISTMPWIVKGSLKATVQTQKIFTFHIINLRLNIEKQLPKCKVWSSQHPKMAGECLKL